MSCFKCYCSKNANSQVVEDILERGQKLRNAIVESILREPFDQDSLNDGNKALKFEEIPTDINKKIKAFLQGDAMTKEDEVSTLETLRSMSATDLCRITDYSYRNSEQCDCLTCREYQGKNLNCDLKRSESSNKIEQKFRHQYKSELGKHIKFVDSLKISVHSINLNEAGEKKVLGSLIKDKVSNVNQTFFLEYQIPEVLSQNRKTKSKVNCGQDYPNLVRLCSRKTSAQSINFRQVSVHDIGNLDSLNLEDIIITFRCSFRNFKQKQPVLLGVAKFNFSSFEVNKNLVCNQELTLRLNENVPIVVGGLKISVQLGCGRLYFGREFTGAVANNKENSVAIESDDFSSNDSDLTEIAKYYYSQNIPTYQKEVPDKKKLQPYIPKLKLVSSNSDIEFENKKCTISKSSNQQTKSANKKSISANKKPTKVETSPKKINLGSSKSESSIKKSDVPPVSSRLLANKTDALRLESNTSSKKHTDSFRKDVNEMSPTKFESPVLFGLIHVREAEFSREVLNSYLRCQLFVSDNTCESRLVAFDSNPVYNFSQQIPLVCDNELLLKLRENFLVVEFFEKGQKDFLIGISKLPLHQFYLAFRNSIIIKYLIQQKLPVIGTDGWESIYNPHNGEVVGQAFFVIALGTKEQVDNLEKERKLNHSKVLKKVIPTSNTADIGIQSEMDSKKDIDSLLNQVVAPKNCNNTVENNENTAEPALRSTSDLLDSLQKALSVDTSKEKSVFKARVVVNSALHLPIRRKCKSKKSKGKSGKHEDILPSTYVTFEDYKGDLIITPIAPKSTSPVWEFKCDVCLPVEHLKDNQKYLVFKVWRKSTNTTMTPNMQVDHVIGFATLDLTVLASGLPSLQGWYNINDLAKKCNGQINIHITPLENVTKYKSENCCNFDQATPTDIPEAPFEPGELLGRALKRKFSELDEITQRLRLRLSKVTNDESDTSNDEIADEFERDINTLCVEDDFDMVNFESEARSFNDNHIKEVGLLQTEHLGTSKQKINLMLEKLSLISGDGSSRYVSGCSEGRIDTEALLTELDNHSRPNLHTGTSFNREMTEKYGSLLSESERSDEQSRSEGDGEMKKDEDK